MIDKKASKYFSAVMQMLLSIIGSALLGYFLEKKIKANGLIFIFTILFGIIIGFIVLYKKITFMDKIN